MERAEEEADVERVTIIREEKEKINNEFEKLHKSEQVKAKMYIIHYILVKNPLS